MALDQSFMAASSMAASVHRFAVDANLISSLNMYILFTPLSISETSVSFLDINVSVCHWQWSSHYCPLQANWFTQLLVAFFLAPLSCQELEQFSRLRQADFISKFDEMCQLFTERGCPSSFVTSALERVRNIDLEKALKPTKPKTEERIPLIHASVPFEQSSSHKYHFKVSREAIWE